MLELSKGTQLANRYTLIRPLGGGGEASVWLAKDKLTAASVALKIVAPNEQNITRLRREWQTNIRLMHPHIARAFEFHSDDDVALFSQQYIDGPSIRAVSGSQNSNLFGPLAMVADALAYVHSKGLVHRDLKAENILLDSNGAPYIVDFGVAAAIDSPVEGGSLISQSPQSLHGADATAADDIFALGGLIYELVAGRSPYSSENTSDDIRSTVPASLVASNNEALPEAI